MSALAEQITQRDAERKARALETYRLHVERVAFGTRTADAAEIDELLDALTALELDPVVVETDAEVLKRVNLVEESIGDAHERMRAATAKAEKLTARMKQLRAELLQLEGEHRAAMYEGRGIGDQVGELNQLRAANPRLFAEGAVAFTKAPAVVSLEAHRLEQVARHL